MQPALLPARRHPPIGQRPDAPFFTDGDIMSRKLSIHKQQPATGRRARIRLETLEDRVLPSTVTWISSSSGSWNTAANWSTGAVPGAGDDVVINQPGSVTVTLAGSTSIHSLSITGDTLDVTSGTLSVAANSSNAGAIQVEPGAHVNLTATYTQTAAGSLTLPSAGLGTGVGTELLGNTGFESPAASNSTTPPGTWFYWGTSYLSTQYAHAGKQSLVEYGANSGVGQSFAATPGVSYTASVYAMTPATNKLTGPEGGFLSVLFYDASGNQISPYAPPNDINVLDANSPTGGPIPGSVGNQGWNLFSTTAVAPSNAATVDVFLQVGPYTGLSGTAGGEVFCDDAQFGTTAVNSGTFNAGTISNSGTITIGAGDTVGAGGTYTQASGAKLDAQLGGPAAGGLYGALSATGTATLGGTLEADLVNNYVPSVGDGFNVLACAATSGTFATYQLPSGTNYVVTSAVNPTYVGVGAVPTTPTTTVNAGTVVGPVSTNMLGVNLAWWDDKLTTTQTQQMVQAAGLTAFRFPGGSSSDDFHFNVSSNYGDPVANTIPQFAQFIEGVGGTGLVTLDYGSGSPQEAAAELAYLEGSPTDTTVIGNGLEWNDNTNAWQQVNWQTVGYWASLRAATPLAHDDGYNFLRINHPAAFAGITYWEVGNEEYGSWEIDHHGTAGPGGVSTGAQHDPATYAAFAHTFATYAAEIDPGISIGIDSGDPTTGFNSWTKNVLIQGQAIGFIPGFISDHSYMQGPGQESDSRLLLHTVSDPSSVLDWSTRYADYQSTLQAALGSQASSVHVMATEFNSVYTNPGKQSTSLVNGLFIADSIGSLLDSGYTGGFVWDLRNGWDPNQNNSPSLYGWRQGGDYGLLGDPNNNSPPSTGPYVPYPNYFAEQLASKIVAAGGQVVSASSNYTGLAAYAVMEANGHLELLVINKNADANLNEQFTVQGFTPSGSAQVWQYGEAQDYAQSQTTDGSSALANFSTTLTLNGSNFNYTFPAYSMTVLDLTPATATVPVATLTGPSDGYHGVDGQTRTFSPGATDSPPSVQQAGFTYTFNWGDGTPSNPDVQTIAATANNGSGLTVNHVFPSAGTFTVSLTATDTNGVTSLPVTLSVNILSVEQQGSTLAVGGGSGNDAYTFTPGASNGTISVTDNGTSLGTFTTGLVQVYGGAGTNTITVNSAAGAHAFTITSTAVAVRGVSISGTGIGSWAVNGLSGTSSFAINGSGLKAALNGGTGSDIFTIAAGVIFDGTIQGGGGADSLINKSNAGSTNSWVLTGANAGTINGASFSGITNLTGGLGNDSFAFQSGASVSGRITGGGGTDTLDWSSYGSAVTANLATKTATAVGSFTGITRLVGSSTTNTLIGTNSADMWMITGANAGTVAGYSFSSFEDLVGGTGVDVFKFSPTGSVLNVNGGGGGDWLDYSLFNTGVLVDLTRGSATAVNGGAAGAVTNIQNVRGGTGNDTLTGNGGNILVGGGGNDTITDAYTGSAASGRSLLIAGPGAGNLTSGSAGDIMIGATTSYNNNNAALAALLAEWQSSDDYNTRFNRIEGLQSGGLNGSYHLVWGTTVVDNEFSDTLVGSTVGLDWFFAQLTGKIADVIDNQNVPGHEHVNNTL
jgi:hypothetical protein